MATYAELRSLFSDSDLRNKMSVAVVIAANTIAQGSTFTDAEYAWAQRAFQSPDREADKVLLIALAENSMATVAQIQGASDATLQASANSAVAVLSRGLTPGA